ncbi:MAG TPA: glycosyltransferase family 39 protein [Polyangiaceae bacterium]|nr:glycosyltransferase family 39 protein [Polyangiaceae bacterium]
MPPAADGTFYDTIARRVASGHGYTWLWPDGAVTYAAHYPVGYPALVALGYRLFGAHPGIAMLENAAVGTLLPLAIHASVASFASRRAALGVGIVAALHPALVTYTPALMTEGVTAALVAIACAVATAAVRRGARRPLRWPLALALGLVLGLATYVRPQCIAFAPALPLAASLSSREALRRGAVIAVLATVGALVTVAPWTARNCDRMGRCALVSVNGGWNLLIGTDASAKGTWAELKVPDACRDVFDEAEKDACFGREARRIIAAHPLDWVALAPMKLDATLDYFGAGPGYLRTAAPGEISEATKRALGALETAVQRLLLAAALFGLARLAIPDAPRRLGRALPFVLAALALFPHATAAYVLLGVGAIAVTVSRGRSRVPPAVPVAGAVILLTALLHAVFFGAGRYGLVLVPATLTLSALALVRPFDTREKSRHS